MDKKENFERKKTKNVQKYKDGKKENNFETKKDKKQNKD